MIESWALPDNAIIAASSYGIDGDTLRGGGEGQAQHTTVAEHSSYQISIDAPQC